MNKKQCSLSTTMQSTPLSFQVATAALAECLHTLRVDSAKMLRSVLRDLVDYLLEMIWDENRNGRR